MITVVHLVVSLGMLLVIPLGLGLMRVGGARSAGRYWWLAAVPGALSLWLDRGAVATTLAVLYLLGTAWLVALAVRLFVVLRFQVRPREVALLTALVTPSVAALALVAERGGHELFGFELSVLSLTVAHFHFAGFVLGDLVELVGAVVLTAGLWIAAGLMWTRTRTLADPGARLLLGLAALVLVATMLLALSWALGHVTDTPYLPVEWMVATHGLANALGFGLCALLAWRRLVGAGAAHALAVEPR